MSEALQRCVNDVYSREERITKVREGIRLILSHFEGRQPIFPRKMSTSLSRGRQFTVYSEEQILNECIKADYIDCRLNAYPVLSDGETTQAPAIIFMDIDLPNNLSRREALEQSNKTLKQTLAIIKQKLKICTPTVLWTGNGYHIYLVLNVRPLELITDLAELSKEPSKHFLKFAEIILTNKKGDARHNHSFNSYLLRIPYTFNSKCIAQFKEDAEVKVFQKFDSSAIPSIDANLLREFRLYLADLDVRDKVKASKVYRRARNTQYSHGISQEYLWIENLLDIPLPDHRKHTLELVLAPYLIIIKRLSQEESYLIINNWIMKCNALRALDSSFEYRAKLAISKSIQNRIPPIKRQTIQKNYPIWYTDFRKWQIFDV